VPFDLTIACSACGVGDDVVAIIHCGLLRNAFGPLRLWRHGLRPGAPCANYASEETNSTVHGECLTDDVVGLC
jgi:hypothetical protein